VNVGPSRRAWPEREPVAEPIRLSVTLSTVVAVDALATTPARPRDQIGETDVCDPVGVLVTLWPLFSEGCLRDGERRASFRPTPENRRHAVRSHGDRPRSRRVKLLRHHAKS